MTVRGHERPSFEEQQEAAIDPVGHQIRHLRRCHQACVGFRPRHQIRDRLSNQVRQYCSSTILHEHLCDSQLHLVVPDDCKAGCWAVLAGVASSEAGDELYRIVQPVTCGPAAKLSDVVPLQVQLVVGGHHPPARDWMYCGAAGPPSASPTSAPGRRARSFTVRDWGPRIRPLPGTTDLEAICLPALRRYRMRPAVRIVNCLGDTRSLWTGVKGVA